MFIFVDESGSFVPGTEQSHAVCCIAGLLIAEPTLPILDAELQRLRVNWGLGVEAELKGRTLGEAQFRAIQEVLALNRAYLVIAAVDIGSHTHASISEHQCAQSARLTLHLNAETHPDLRKQIEDLAVRIAKLPSQLYVQMIMLNQLVQAVLQLALLRYPQTEPSQLSRFAWRLDAKDSRRTEYENLWRKLVAPFAQSASLRAPFIFIKDADYSAFGPFENPNLRNAPPHLRSHVSKPDEPMSNFDVKRVLLEDLDFLDSKAEIGLQLADVMASCFQRACNDRLRREGWVGLSRLLIRDPRLGQAIHFGQVGGHRASQPVYGLPYAGVILALEKAASHFLLAP